jgi:hypothetical protein
MPSTNRPSYSTGDMTDSCSLVSRVVSLVLLDTASPVFSEVSYPLGLSGQACRSDASCRRTSHAPHWAPCAFYKGMTRQGIT